MTPFAPDNPERSLEDIVDRHGIAPVMDALRANCMRRSVRLVRTDLKGAQLWERRARLISSIVSAVDGTTKQVSDRIPAEFFMQRSDTNYCGRYCSVLRTVVGDGQGNDASRIPAGAIVRVIEQRGRVYGVEYCQKAFHVMDDNLEITGQSIGVNPGGRPRDLDVNARAAATHRPSDQLVGWLQRALVALATRNFMDAKSGCSGIFPGVQEWPGLAPKIQHIFIRSAIAESGIPADEYREITDRYESVAGSDANAAADVIWQEPAGPSLG